MIPLHENLKNRVAVITGGSGVLCSQMARELARHGVKVAILNRTAEKGQKIADEIQENGGVAISISTDVLSRKSLEEAKEEVIAAFGHVNILINGAGGNHPTAITDSEIYDEESPGKSFFDLEEQGFLHVFDSNFTGSFLASQVFGSELLKAESPVIVNISSMSAYAPMTKVPAYSAAKSAINNFTMWMAVHFAETGLRVNAIAPGFFLTTQNRNLLLDEDGNYTARSQKILAGTPMKRFGQPKDLLGTLLWLVDNEYSGFVTGVTVPVDGGFMAYSGV
ncbi:SDR family oxidoreductase [Aneurinibacillus migulanus]|uniref:D-mannonate oxidoreductase n=1 Tax=Aneurinibacillus migulanus TaxID=47500 RepID=A0A0D1VFD2_ANEMI|nr:SDR family oxidoreductase [Aneurinibacillus migulanus]KIV58179.1 D-mannonate oxidoreductase [Aneurinibacillus migulanus]KON96947.1 D-mannonate oxidoreductase [Aneurinibacillus migulanus]MED0896251.1 SDR family oxidoreductase [Aneurinibacillus migulanus]MED1618079.1 SDR family oxidoreductase [Aneurinibacillus migulanus]SDJ60287.1 short chain dehydrogenase [Aneurinibacillus migulanus]